MGFHLTALLAVTLALAAPVFAEDEEAAPDDATEEETRDESDADRDAPPDRRRTKPLWEIGLVGGGGSLPDYPAASQNHLRGIGLPYAIYRGNFLQVGERGIVRGLFLDLRQVEFDLSADASFPTDSSDNNARDDMPNLDALFEVGPKLIYKFLPRGSDQELDASIATRAVISTDLSNWHYQGFVVNPSLTYRDERFLDGDLRLVASINPLFGYDGINRYFYQVKPRFARPERPEYDADGGYIGTELTLGGSWSPIESLRFFGGIRPGYYGGATNSNSPLHRDNFNIAVGGGLRWTLFTSDRRVQR